MRKRSKYHQPVLKPQGVTARQTLIALGAKPHQVEKMTTMQVINAIKDRTPDPLR